MRPSSFLSIMGLRHPRYPKSTPLGPRRTPPKAHYPFYHPLRSQYPHPAPKQVKSTVERNLPHCSNATHYRITLKRSPLGLPEKIHKALITLGLQKKDRTVFHPFSPNTAGSILRVKELVHVRLVDWETMAKEMKVGKGENEGFVKSETLVEEGQTSSSTNPFAL